MKRVTTNRKDQGLGKLKSGLESLVYFMNLDLDTTREEDVIEDPISWVHLPGMLRSARGKMKAKRLQSELRRDLMPLVNPTKEYDLLDEAFDLLDKLVTKIDKMNLRSHWVGMPVDEAGPGTLVILDRRWEVYKEIDRRSLRHSLYWNLIHSLESGELSSLKVCPECSRYFIQADARQGFCNHKCRIEFNNKQRLQTGYFKNRRQTIRRKSLSRARRLLREGKSLNEVSNETRLSLRVLKRAVLMRG